MNFIFPRALKIAAEQIQQQLQQREPADQLEEIPQGTSALRLLGKRTRPTATEPAPKLVSTTGTRG
jgi:hypothetical protein